MIDAHPLSEISVRVTCASDLWTKTRGSAAFRLCRSVFESASVSTRPHQPSGDNFTIFMLDRGKSSTNPIDPSLTCGVNSTMAPQHQRSESYPISPSQYEDSPTFVYSAARPPTNYSHYSWTPPSGAVPGRQARRSSLPPPLPTLAASPPRHLAGPSKISPESDYSTPPRQLAHLPPASSSSSSSEYSPPHRTGASALPAETPLYAPSSWDDPYNASGSDSDSIRSPARPWMQQNPNTAGLPMTSSSHGRSAYVPDRDRPDSWADEPTAWSKSSYGTRPRTAAPVKSGLGTVYEEQDYEEKGYYDDISLAPQTAPQTAPSAYTPQIPGRGGVPAVPDINEWYNPKSARMSRHSRRSSAPLGRAMYDSPGLYTARHSFGGQGAAEIGGYADRGRTASRHTVGSVFDMNALSAHPYPPDFTPGPNEKRGQPAVPPLPTGQLPMLSPSKQHQLGRMSVAPARYTLPPSARPPGSAPDRTPRTAFQPNGFPPPTAVQNPYVADPFADPPQDPAFDVGEKAAERFYQQQNQSRGLDSGVNPYRDPALGWEPAPEADLQADGQRNAFGSTLDKVRNSTFGVYYRTYRPFVRPLLTISGAMCLNLTMQGPAGGTEWGTMVKLAKGGMGVMPPETDGKEVGLGLLGWCALGGDT